MNDELRVKLAERLGWTYIERLALTGIPERSRGTADARVIPDLASLVSQSEQGLSDEQLGKYANALVRIALPSLSHVQQLTFQRITASPEDRARALLEVSA